MSIEQSINQARKARLERIAARAMEPAEPASTAPPQARRPRVKSHVLDLWYEAAWALEMVGLPDRRPRMLSVGDIARATADHFGLDPHALFARGGGRAVVRARHLAIYLTRRLTTKSFAEIGERFGAPDHTLARYAVRRIEGLIVRDKQLAGNVKQISSALGHPQREGGEGLRYSTEEAY
jgi:hypothetical protein